jgi:hypothetical protein
MYPKVNFQDYFALFFEFTLPLIGILAAAATRAHSSLGVVSLEGISTAGEVYDIDASTTPSL